jgi:Transposase DDE domain group 1
VVLTRRRDAENPQGHLWDADGYNYAAYVTDVDWVPEDVVAFYDKRADMEKAIHELKEDFGIDRITSSAFGANAADLELKVLAFNLLVLYQRQALGWSVLQRAKTLRRRVIAIAGQLIRTAGQWMLKLTETWAGHADLGRAHQHLAALGP